MKQKVGITTLNHSLFSIYTNILIVLVERNSIEVNEEDKNGMISRHLPTTPDSFASLHRNKSINNFLLI